MTDSWQLFIFLGGLIAAWSILIVAVLRTMFGAHRDDINGRLEGWGKNINELEKNFLELKADLPLSYVRKEDFVRFEVVINTKLDRVHDAIENLKERI